MSDKQIRKQNLRQLRLEYGKSFYRALEERHLTPEEFSAESKIPLKFVKEHLSGEIRFFGHLNYISFLLNKRIKIKLIDYTVFTWEPNFVSVADASLTQ